MNSHRQIIVNLTLFIKSN